jgi:hypothetical protein
MDNALSIALSSAESYQRELWQATELGGGRFVRELEMIIFGPERKALSVKVSLVAVLK